MRLPHRLAIVAAAVAASSTTFVAAQSGPPDRSAIYDQVDTTRVYMPDARAGDPVAPAAPAIHGSLRLGHAVGLGAMEGTPWGYGPRYEITFHDGTIEFMPTLGQTLAEARTFCFRLESVGRASDLRPVRDAMPVARDREVTYDRGVCVERYEVRAEGVEQSFTFARLPGGSGDLVVRGRITTPFVASSTAAVTDGLTFERDGAGVAIGAVTGIDALGRAVRGSMRCDGDVLELRLPARFVESAALPLVLDPLLSGTTSVSTLTNDDRDPDVAYDATTGTYLCVFEREVSGTWRIRAQRVSTAGAVLGGYVAIRDSTTLSAYEPRVANVTINDTFVVVWREDYDILARAVSADGTTLSNTVTVAGGTDLQLYADVGGEATLSDNDAVVVWQNASQNLIQAAQVQVSSPSTIGVIVGAPVTIVTQASGATDSLPAIAKSGGATGRYLVVHQRQLTTTGIRGVVIDRNLGIVDDIVGIANNSGAGPDTDDPEVDGDGTNWCVAYELEESSGSADDDIACRFVGMLGSNALASAEVIVEGDPGDDEQNPSVAWVGGSCLIAYADEDPATPGDYDALVTTVDPFTCLVCETEGGIDVGAGAQDYILMASQRSGDPEAGDDVFIVYESRDLTTFDGDIFGRIYRAEDGYVTDVGGGCGSGGTTYATCARRGHSGFEHRVRNAIPRANAWLVLSTDRIDALCGSCTLVPNPFTGVLFAAGTTDSYGNASVAMAIPSSTALIGVTFYDQWIVASTSPSCAPLGSDLSNAIRVEIQ